MVNFGYKTAYIFTSLYVAGYNSYHSRYEYEYEKGVSVDGKNINNSRLGTSSARTEKPSLDRQTGERFSLVRRSCRRLRECPSNRRSDNDNDNYSLIPVIKNPQVGQSAYSRKNPKHLQGKAGIHTNIYKTLIKNFNYGLYTQSAHS